MAKNEQNKIEGGSEIKKDLKTREALLKMNETENLPRESQENESYQRMKKNGNMKMILIIQ